MSIGNVGPMRIDPTMPDASRNDIENWDLIQQHQLWIAFAAAFGGPRADKYFFPTYGMRAEYDDNGNLIAASLGDPKLLFHYTIEWEDAGGGWRPTKYHYYIDTGTGEPAVAPPPEAELPDVGSPGGGLVYLGNMSLSYQDTNPNSCTGGAWNPYAP